MRRHYPQEPGLASRFFWISTSGIQNRLTGKEDALEVVQSPRTYSSTAFQAAVRAIRRHVRTAGGEANLGVIEGFEADTAVRMVNDHGHRLYRSDKTGAVASVERIEVPEMDEPAGPSGP